MSFYKLSILFKQFTILLLCSALFAPLSNSAHGQLFKTAMAGDISESDFFVVVTREGGNPSGLLGLFGLTDSSAQTTTYHFGMRDKNGYQYETLDLIKPRVVDELELSPKQVDVISGIKSEAYADLVKMISDSKRKFAEAPSGTVSAADFERSYKESLEEKFYSALADIKSTLDEAQLSKLEQINHQNGIKQLGLAKYLSSSHFNVSISDEDAKALQQVAVQFEKLSKENSLDLLKAANKKLLGKLTSEQQKQLAAEFKSGFTETLLATAMFTRNYSPNKKLVNRKTNLYRILKLKNIRTSIGLSEKEYSEIKELDVELRDQLNEKLTSTQSMKLKETVVSRDLNQMGTVNSITSGHLRDVLEIDDEQANRLYAAGKKINVELMEQLISIKKEAFQEATSVLSSSLQKSLEEKLGDCEIELPETE